MRRSVLVLLVACLALAACALPLTEEPPSAAESTTTTSPRTSTTEGLPVPPTIPIDPEVAALLGELPGRLVVNAGPYIGILNPDGSRATLVGGDPATPASQPTWYNQGALLAWSEIRPAGPVIVVYDPTTDVRFDSELDGPAAFYLQWNHSDQVVSYLRNDPNGNGIEAGVSRPGEPLEVYDTGAPHYFEWAPDQDVWLSHVEQERLNFVDATTVFPVTEPLRPFTTPRWLDAERVLFAGPEGFIVLDIVLGERQVFPLPAGPVEFTSTDDGTRVAYLEPGSVAGRRGGRLVVLDLETGDVTPVTDDPVVAWEWSPDGRRLAWTELDRADAADLAILHFWDAEEEAELSVTPSFRPSDPVLTSYLPFFPQYAVSHSAWAPDGSAYAFAGNIGGDAGIWIHAIDAGVEAARIQSGDVVFWSPDDASLAGGGRSPL